MLRRILISLLVLVSLTSQASVAFACDMMGGGHTVVVKRCCCDHPGMGAPACDPSAKAEACCHKVVELSAGPGDQIGGLAVAVKLPSYDPQPLSPFLLPAVFAIDSPAVVLCAHRDEYRAQSLYGPHLYLRTQRLRL